MTASFENESVPGRVTGLSIQQENQRGELHRQQHSLLFDGVQVLVPLEGSRICEFPSSFERCTPDGETCSIYRSAVQLLSVSQT